MSKIKIITGLRTFGKSYLLPEIYKKYLLDNGVDKNQLIIVELVGEETG